MTHHHKGCVLDKYSIAAGCFSVCLFVKVMSRLWLFSPYFSRFHFRGVSVVSEHTRSIQRGKLLFMNATCSACGVKVMPLSTVIIIIIIMENTEAGLEASVSEK